MGLYVLLSSLLFIPSIPAPYIFSCGMICLTALVLLLTSENCINFSAALLTLVCTWPGEGQQYMGTGPTHGGQGWISPSVSFLAMNATFTCMTLEIVGMR